jgi:hypothetical protein
LTFEASEIDIKMRFRKLASKHHPDKNGGSKKSEETFKVILDAYETLSNREKRAIYDLKYQQFFQYTRSETTNQNNTNTKEQTSRHQSSRKKEYPQKEKIKPKVKYGFWVILVILVMIYLYNKNTTNAKVNSMADKQLEEEPSESRPETGELDFNK